MNKMMMITGQITPLSRQSQTEINILTIISRLNQVYASQLLTDFTLHRAGLLEAQVKPNADLLQILDYLHLSLAEGYQLQIGIGLGELDDAVQKTSIFSSNSQAQREAEKALTLIQTQDDYGSRANGFSSDYPHIDKVINSLLATSDFMRDRWSHSQKQFILRLVETGIYSEHFKQKSLAQKLKLSQSAFTKRVKSTGIKVYLRNQETAMELMMQLS
ncbi:TPA: SatD family protein, partial [Streptococcus suis]